MQVHRTACLCDIVFLYTSSLQLFTVWNLYSSLEPITVVNLTLSLPTFQTSCVIFQLMQISRKSTKLTWPLYPNQQPKNHKPIDTDSVENQYLVWLRASTTAFTCCTLDPRAWQVRFSGNDDLFSSVCTYQSKITVNYSQGCPKQHERTWNKTYIS